WLLYAVGGRTGCPVPTAQEGLMQRPRLALSLGAGAACLAAGLVWALFLVPAAPGKTGAAAQKAVTTTITVTMGKPSEFAFKLSKRQAPAGSVVFKVTNGGKVPHTFEICSGTKGTIKANACAGK